MAKAALIAMAVGGAGVLAGILAFYATGVLVPDVRVQAVTGGLFAVMVPLVLGMLLYSWLAGKNPDDS